MSINNKEFPAARAIKVAATLGLLLSAMPTILRAQEQVLDVSQCVNMALKQSPQAVSARTSLTVAGAGLQSSVSGILPRLGASSSYEQSGPTATYDSFLNPVEGGKRENYRTSFNLNQSLVNLSQWAEIYGSYRSRQAAQSSYQQATALLVYSVKEAYYSLVKLQKAVEVAEASVKQSEEQLKQARLMHQLGSLSQSDLLKIQVRLIQSRVDLLTAQRNKMAGQQYLANILGLSGEVRVEAELSFPDTLRQLAVLDSLAEETAEGKPSYLAAQRERSAQQASLWSARLAKLPYLSFSYSYGYSDSLQFAGNDSWNAHDYWSASLSLNWNIMDGGASWARVRQARALARQAEAKMHSARQEAYSEIKQAKLGMKTALETMSLVGDLQQQASEDYRLTSEKYRLGSASVLDLLTSQLTFNQARQQATNALCDYYLAQARIDRALGRW